MSFTSFRSIHPRLSFLLTSAIAAAVMGSSAFWLEHSGMDSESSHHAGIVNFPRALDPFEPSPLLFIDGGADADGVDISDGRDRISLAAEASALVPEGSIAVIDSRVITIDRCNGIVAHANLRAGPSQQSDRLGVIVRGDQAQLTGLQRGAYHAVSVPYWGEGPFSSHLSPHERLGNGWLHQCWLGL